MVIFETAIFTDQIIDLIDDDAYAEFQEMLCKKPDAGDLIQGTGGLRKIRYGILNRGKRGGARIIYYWFDNKNQI